MDFQQLIKKEWEKEFPIKDQKAWNFEESIFHSAYKGLVERICVRVWNSALDLAAEEVEGICDSSDIFQSIDEQSILKFKIDEQGIQSNT